VELCLVTHRSEDRDALLEVLARETDAGRTLMRSAQDDVLRWVDLSGTKAPAGARPAPSAEPGSWFQRLIAVFREGVGHANPVVTDPALAAAHDESDVAIHVVGAEDDLAAARPLLHWLGKPVLVLAHPPAVADAPARLLAQCETEVRRLGVPAAVLPFQAFAGCWVQESALLEAIGRLLPEAKQAGFARIRSAWEERSSARLVRAMGAVADHLLFAARQVEEIHSDAISVRSLVPAQRTVEAQARQQAIDRVVQRLDASAAEMFARMRKLHGVEEVAAGALQHRLEEKFVVQRPVHTPQAGMAGAATGAAMGASVDLLVGGLTLGAATALGALVGGSAAFIAAAWKNRSTSSGSTVVQLSDEMMQAMVEAALLRYLAVAHYGRGASDASGELRPFWKSEVVAAVEARKAMLTPFWTAARTQPDAGRLALALARELETLARQVLAALHRAPTIRAQTAATA
jgi:hypothetical protein